MVLLLRSSNDGQASVFGDADHLMGNNSYSVYTMQISEVQISVNTIANAQMSLKHQSPKDGAAG